MELNKQHNDSHPLNLLGILIALHYLRKELNQKILLPVAHHCREVSEDGQI
jgi:hypothetical protein